MPFPSGSLQWLLTDERSFSPTLTIVRVRYFGYPFITYTSPTKMCVAPRTSVDERRQLADRSRAQSTYLIRSRRLWRILIRGQRIKIEISVYVETFRVRFVTVRNGILVDALRQFPHVVLDGRPVAAIKIVRNGT